MNKLSFIFVLSCIALANAYSSGAPPGTCKNGLIPAGHEVEPQKSASPYSLKIDRDAYPVEIVVSLNNSKQSGRNIKSFFENFLADFRTE